MSYLVKVHFQNSNKHYNFSSDIEGLEVGNKVVVETIKGIELATVVTKPVDIEQYKGEIELKPISRIATGEDLLAYINNQKRAVSAAKIFVAEQSKLKLDMRLLQTEYTLDATKVIFTYSAADRVDFRELLKVLSSKLKVKIELKQIAPRDRAQLVGGVGMCGLPLCCSTFLNEFDRISLNRAKNQMLSINIPKLSGQCGSLLCCLKFEDDIYTEEKKNFPALNTKLKVNDKEYKLTGYNILSRTCKLEGEENIINLSLDEVNKILNGVPEEKEEKEQKEQKDHKDQKKHKDGKDHKHGKDNKNNKKFHKNNKHKVNNNKNKNNG